MAFRALSEGSFAGGPPESAEGTPRDVEMPYIKLTQVDSRTLSTHLYRLELPGQRQECLAEQCQPW